MVLSMFSFRMLSAESQERTVQLKYGQWRDMERHGETWGEQRVCNKDEEHARPLLMCFPWVPPVLLVGFDLEDMPLVLHSQVHPGA